MNINNIRKRTMRNTCSSLSPPMVASVPLYKYSYCPSSSFLLSFASSFSSSTTTTTTHKESEQQKSSFDFANKQNTNDTSDNDNSTTTSTTSTSSNTNNGKGKIKVISKNTYNERKRERYQRQQNEQHKHRHQHSRPMVHLSSAPNIKFTGRSIGHPHPTVPHPITPQRTVLVQQKQKQQKKQDGGGGGNGNDNTSYSILPPRYALDGGTKTSHVGRSRSTYTLPTTITINDYETIEKIRGASALAARMLKKACEIAQSPILSPLSSSPSPSFVTTDDIDRIIHETIIQSYNEDGTACAYPSPLNYNRFPKSICTSVNEVICHGIPDTRALQYGDLLSIDISVFLNGVHGDNCASIVIGVDDDGENKHGIKTDNVNNLSDNYRDNNNHEEDDDDDDKIMDHVTRAQTLVHATKEALYRAIEICTPGTPLNQIGNAVQNVAEQYGYRSVKGVYGHGIGKELHMYPPIKHVRNSDDSIKLQPGMVITIEPVLVEGHHAYAIWEDGWSKCTVDGGLGAQFEHTILITDDAPEILTVAH